MTLQRTISPVDGSVYVERELAPPRAIDAALERARHAQQGWRTVPVEARISSFRATESATAYVCLNSNGPLLESPGTNGALAVAFRFDEGTADALRIDAIDVKKDVCDEE